MNNNLTEIVTIVDESGSMFILKDDTIGGYNKFIEDQKNISGDVNLTTVFFSDFYSLKNDRVDLKNIKNLTKEDYCPGGATALFDAIGKTINNIGNKLSSIDEKDRPSKVLFLIITDGYENASKEFTKEKIKEMIEHQKSKYSWEFIFFGANIDAMKEGCKIGISNNINYTANSDGITKSYNTMSNATALYRTTGKVDNLPNEVK